MSRRRLITLALSASLGLICGCRSCFELSFQGLGRPAAVGCAPAAETCASPFFGGGCDGAGLEDGPALVPPAGCGMGVLPPPPPLPAGVVPQPRLVPQPQAAVQPYQPASQPRLLSALDK